MAEVLEKIAAYQFASAEDYEVCRALHKQYGTTYYYSTKLFPREIQQKTHAVYGFVRVADEWVDHPQGMTPDEIAEKLDDWRTQLQAGTQGTCPAHPVMRAFCDVLSSTGIPLQEAELFLDAMEMDITKTRYSTFQELREYMRGSASAVGVMMGWVCGIEMKAENVQSAMALGEAMQLTNFIRDVREDFERGRIYLPSEELARFGVSESDIASHRVNSAWIELMKFQIERARGLYAEAMPGIRLLQGSERKAILLARVLYSRILDRIEKGGYDVFQTRFRTSSLEKLCVCAGVLSGRSFD